MQTERTPRWRRRRASRDSLLRHVLAGGAAVGLGAGVLAQLVIGDPHGELDWLVRIALLLPVGVYVAWWLFGPGIGPVDQGSDAIPTLDAQERLERIEAVFDTAAVPRPRREQPQVGSHAPGLEEFRASIRRDPGVRADPDSFGIRRPVARQRRESTLDS
jgi:hypothetical protein